MISEPLIAGVLVIGPLFLGVALLAKSQGGWVGWGSFSVMLLIAAFGRYLVQHATDFYLSYFSTSASTLQSNSSGLLEQANVTAETFNRMQDTSVISESVGIILLVIFQLAFLVLCISIYRKIHKARLPGSN